MQSAPPALSRATGVASAIAALILAGCGDSRSESPGSPQRDPVAASGRADATRAPDGARTARRPAPAPKQVPAPEPSRPAGPPVFEIVPPSVDLGVLDANEKKEIEFEVFNRSDKPFSISAVSTGCKCVTLKFDREPIPPGASARVRTRVRAAASGMKTTVARINFTDAARSSGKIPFSYSTVPGVLLDPKRIEFGRVQTGMAKEATTSVTLHLPENIPDPVLEPFLQHDLPIELSIDPPVIKPGSRGMRDLVTTLRLRLKSDEPLPRFTTQLIFQAKTPKTFRTTMIPVTGQVAPAWRFERHALSFGVVRVGVPMTRTMRFYWAGATPPEVHELRSDIPELTATLEPDPSRRCFLVSVTCLGAKGGRIEGSIQLKTSLSDTPSTLKVTARAK